MQCENQYPTVSKDSSCISIRFPKGASADVHECCSELRYELNTSLCAAQVLAGKALLQLLPKTYCMYSVPSTGTVLTDHPVGVGVQAVNQSVLGCEF